MNELLHKFKLGNEAELLLEKRGGGYEKVATVPIGSQALMVTQSAQGVVDFARSMRQTCVFKNLPAPSIGVASTTPKQTLQQVKIPAGTLKIGDIVKLTIGVVKSGSADTATGLLTAGPLNTFSDGALLNGPNLATTITSVGSVILFQVTSLTTLRGVGAVNPLSSLSTGSTSATWLDVTIGSADSTDNYIGLYYTMTAGSEFPTLRNFIVEIIPAVP